MRKLSFAGLVMGLVLLATGTAHGQAPAAPVGGGVPGPGGVTRSANRPHGVSSVVPASLTEAHTVFLSNGGAEAGLFPHPFAGTQDRGYGYFLNALNAARRFDVVARPEQADLVLELALAAPTGALGGDKQRGTQDALPRFTLVIYDRPTHYVLWTLSVTIDKANLQKTHDKNFDNALDLLYKDLITVASGATPAAAPVAAEPVGDAPK